MNQSNKELNLFWPKLKMFLSRIILLILIITLTYVISRPSYNFAHWIPHNFIRQLGLSYDSILWAEQHADVALHFFGGFAITLLTSISALPFLKTKPLRILVLVCILCVAAELLQLRIGRGFDYLDLLLGILGGFMAYLAINKNKKSSH
jgi:hypothetical protein